MNRHRSRQSPKVTHPPPSQGSHDTSSSGGLALSHPWRIVLSVLAIVHLLAVFAEPFRFFSQSPVKPASEEAAWLRQTLAPYVEFMYLSHGYAFFAPNPGPAHLLQARFSSDPSSAMETSPSKQNQWTSNAEQRIFPDRSLDRPRLLYHRYFMLSEFYHNLFAPVQLTEQDQQDQLLMEQWRQDRQLYEQLQDSVIRSVKAKYAKEQVQLRRIEHALPVQEQIFGEGKKLTDPSFYVELSDGESSP
jgi:hypothetical protein